MFEKISLSSFTHSITQTSNYVWGVAKRYLSIETEHDAEVNKTEPDKDEAALSLVSTLQQGMSRFHHLPKKILLLTGLALAYYANETRQNDAYRFNSSSSVNFNAYFSSDLNWNYLTPISTQTLGSMAVIYGVGSLLNNRHSYAQETSLLSPIGLILSSFLPMIEGQVPSPEFLTVFGGGAYDFGPAIITTASDDIVLAGQTNGFGASNYDVLVSMLYANGSLAWSYTLGGVGNDGANALAMTNSSIIAVGTTTFGGIDDVLIANLYANGSLAWAVTLGGSSYDQGLAVTTTVSGDIVITGTTNSFGAVNYDVLVAKLYANGSVAWARALGGTNTDYGTAITTTVTDDIVVVGYTNSFVAGNYNLLVTKLYSNGSLAWMRSLGGNLVERGYALDTTASGDIVVLGYTTSFGAGGEDALLVKLYANGSVAWARTLGGGLTDDGYAFATTANGDIVVSGSTDSFGAGSYDVLLAQFFADGSLAWARTLGGIDVDTSSALKITALGDIVISSNTYSFGIGNSDILVARLAANGTFLNCNLTRTASLTVLDWPNITNTLVTPTVISINTTGLVRNWTTVSMQFIAPQVLSLCNASISSPSTMATSAPIASSASTTSFSTNPSSTFQTSASTATSVVSSLPTPSSSSSLSPSGTNASFISTADLSVPSALTNSSSSSLSADTSNTAVIRTTVSTESSTNNNNQSSPLSSDTSTGLTSSALISTTVSTVPSTSSNNPSSSSTNVPTSQSSASITFSVSVGLNSIVIERGISTTLTSDIISLSGNASPDQVLFTVQGDNPDLTLTVNGVETTQFTYQDILDNFVEVELSGTCDPAPEISLQAEVPGSQSPPNRLTLFFASTSTNCNHASRFGNDDVLFSSALLLSTAGIGFLAKRREVEQPEKIPAQANENTMRFRY